MTRDEVISEMARVVKNTATRNRIQAILATCKTIEEFAGLSNSEILERYRQTALGKKATCDLGRITYDAVGRIQALILERERAEKTAERDAKKAELWFTKDEMTIIAAFMASFNIAKIELWQMRKILAAVVKNDKSVEAVKKGNPVP